MRASHRTRLTLITSASVAIVLGVVFAAVWALMRQAELNSARTYLNDGLLAAVQDLKNGKSINQPEWDKNHSLAKLAIFDNGKSHKTPQIAVSLHGFGLANRNGSVIVYRSADVKGKTLVASLDLTQWRTTMYPVNLVLFALYPVLVGIVAFVTWQSARATFRPLQEMSYQAAAIGGSDFTARIDVEDAAEFGLFAAQLNALLTRIEDAVRAQEQFAADAAHELRTPLTVMRGKIETALLTSRTPEEYSKTLRALLKEVDRLTRLSEALLESAKPESIHAPLLNIEPAVWEVASRWLDRFVAKKVLLEVNSGPANVNIRREEIACVLDNLLANALRYSPPGSCCEITLVEAPTGVTLSVQDEGTGIKGGGLQAFERFWRADGARSRQSGGFGIGLSVCKRLVESRNGKITVDPAYTKGAKICINFPFSNQPANLAQPVEVSLRNA